MVPPAVIAVVLAAGEGTRFDGATHKLLAPFRGGTVVGHAVESAIAAEIGPVLVVTGAVEMVLPTGVDAVHNPHWADGQATSLRVAIDAASAAGASSIVVGLGDQPLVGPAAWRAVARSDGGPIVAATFDGRRRPPVRLDRAVWSLLPHSGDEGARVLMRQHPNLVAEIAVDGEPVDIDTLEDLNRWS